MSEMTFVPNGDSRKETAVLLVGTADEYGIDQRSIKTTPSGFLITKELADILYDEDDSDTKGDTRQDAKPATKKTSGNRAAKTGSKKKE